MEWISNCKYNQQLEEGTIFQLKGIDIKLCIHHYAGCGDLWYLSCPALGVNTYNLDTNDFDKAVVKAQEYLDDIVVDLYNKIRKFTLDNSANIMVKY